METLPCLLVIEDGDDYLTFARLFLSDRFRCVGAKSLQQALPLLSEAAAIFLDIRFDASAPEELYGDIAQIAKQFFGGDLRRAESYRKENQGFFILARLRELGFTLPAVVVNDLPARRIENLQKLYGQVYAVPEFNAHKIREVLQQQLAKR
jgi:hypothetical protein